MTWLHANDYPLSAVEEIITGTKDSDGVYSEYPAYRDARRPPALLMLRRTYDLGVPPMRCRGVRTADWPAVPVCCTVLPRSGDLNTERKFPSDKVYRPDDRGSSGSSPSARRAAAFIVIHTSVGRAACRQGSTFAHACPGLTPY